MRTLAASALIAALLLPSAALACTWEYKVVEVDLVTKIRVFANDQLLAADELEALLGPLGEEGWELVSSINRGGTVLLLVLKRHVHGETCAPEPPPVPPVEPPAPPVEPPAPPAATDEPAPVEEAAE